MELKICDNLMLQENQELKINKNTENFIKNHNNCIFILQDEFLINNIALILANNQSNFFIININGNENLVKTALKPFLKTIDKVLFTNNISKDDIKEILNLNYDNNIFNKIRKFSVDFLSSI